MPLKGSCGTGLIPSSALLEGVRNFKEWVKHEVFRSLVHALTRKQDPWSPLLPVLCPSYGMSTFALPHTLHHNVLPHTGLMEPTKHKLKSPKPWARINLSFLQAAYLKCFATVTESWLTQPLLYYFIFYNNGLSMNKTQN